MLRWGPPRGDGVLAARRPRGRRRRGGPGGWPWLAATGLGGWWVAGRRACWRVEAGDRERRAGSAEGARGCSIAAPAMRAVRPPVIGGQAATGPCYTVAATRR
jgi:hypothetical protein